MTVTISRCRYFTYPATYRTGITLCLPTLLLDAAYYESETCFEVAVLVTVDGKWRRLPSECCALPVRHL